MARINEALSEIRAVGRKDPALAAEGAVLFLEKISPAICDIDSSSGALGNAVYLAVETLVPILVAAPVAVEVRAKWLDRLFDAMQDDDPPYIENLGDHWGELCAGIELATHWADHLLSLLRHVMEDRSKGTYAYSNGTVPCCSALFAAGRHDELLKWLALDPRPHWQHAIWGARVLAARGQIDEAIDYLRRHGGNYLPASVLARFAEEGLRKAGRWREAYQQHAIAASQASSRIATFRAIAARYPELEPDRILADLMASTPGDEGKWFATAKTLKRFDLATRLAWHSPCDPKTLTRAARDHLADQPAFAVEVAVAALHWISLGYGYDLMGLDVSEAYRYAREAGERMGQLDQVEARLRKVLAAGSPTALWMQKVLGSVMIQGERLR